MVSVKMADEDAIHMGGRHVGMDELALRPFAGIEEKPFFIPAH